ncbi:MAG: YfiR family protein [Burkholderiaceae bacterium]
MTKLLTQHNNRIAAIRRFSVALASVITCLGVVAFATAAPSAVEPSEYAIKAAFLFKFGAYIEWPSDTFETPKTPLVIGIVGDDPFDGTLDNIVAGHTIDGRPVEIVRDQQIDKIKNEQILFISQSEKEKMAPIVSNLQGKKILTVSEFNDPNIIIQFVIENEKVRFDINLDQANSAGIKLSSKLLSVARTVKRK